ncbi:hypothetical protein BDD12DRAFT_807360 [Trichophaea hybrida]|nr:hypothetical protein BDD12DRAFT_807360 [Trichophaea hybrida]
MYPQRLRRHQRAISVYREEGLRDGSWEHESRRESRPCFKFLPSLIAKRKSMTGKTTERCRDRGKAVAESLRREVMVGSYNGYVNVRLSDMLAALTNRPNHGVIIYRIGLSSSTADVYRVRPRSESQYRVIYSHIMEESVARGASYGTESVVRKVLQWAAG